MRNESKWKKQEFYLPLLHFISWTKVFNPNFGFGFCLPPQAFHPLRRARGVKDSALLTRHVLDFGKCQMSGSHRFEQRWSRWQVSFFLFACLYVCMFACLELNPKNHTQSQTLAQSERSNLCQNWIELAKKIVIEIFWAEVIYAGLFPPSSNPNDHVSPYKSTSPHVCVVFLPAESIAFSSYVALFPRGGWRFFLSPLVCPHTH